MSTNNKCRVMVDQYIPTSNGLGLKNISVPCGSTGYYGSEVRCEECSKERPWYICEHGVDHRGDGDCYCHLCEMAA